MGADLWEDESFMVVAWQQVVDQNDLPFAVLTEPDLVRPLGAVVLGQDNALHQLWTLRKDRQRTQEPEGDKKINRVSFLVLVYSWGIPW